MEDGDRGHLEETIEGRNGEGIEMEEETIDSLIRIDRDRQVGEEELVLIGEEEEGIEESRGIMGGGGDRGHGRGRDHLLGVRDGGSTMIGERKTREIGGIEGGTRETTIGGIGGGRGVRVGSGRGRETIETNGER